MALENLEPAVRMEEILDGQDIEPATRLEYFLKKAAEGGGGGGGGSTIHVVRATGDVVVREDDKDHYVEMQSDIPAGTIIEWVNGGEPVFCFAPSVRYTQGGSYSYTDVSMALIQNVDRAPMVVNSDATSLIFYVSEGVFEWYFENIL